MVTTCSVVTLMCVALSAMSCHVVPFLKLKLKLRQARAHAVAPEVTIQYVGLQIECRKSSYVSPRIS